MELLGLCSGQPDEAPRIAINIPKLPELLRPKD
jgi:hypothetical protein